MMNRIKSICLASSLLTSLGIATVSYADVSNTQTSLTALSQSVTSDEHVVWQRAPITVILPVGQERFVTFPSVVQFGYNVGSLPSSTLRVENNNQTLYFTAKQVFSTQRVEAKLSNGEIILMDLSARAGADTSPIDIVLPQQTTPPSHSEDISYAKKIGIDYVSLTRFAVQQLYAPERLLSDSSSMTRFPMGTAHVVPLVYDNSVSAMPLASWRGGNLYVTAVLMKNLLNQPLKLDPRLICGNWQAATFYPQNSLASRGTPINRDTSTLFVVSDRPFAEAIQSCLH